MPKAASRSKVKYFFNISQEEHPPANQKPPSLKQLSQRPSKSQELLKLPQPKLPHQQHPQPSPRQQRSQNQQRSQRVLKNQNLQASQKLKVQAKVEKQREFRKQRNDFEVIHY